MTRLTRDDQATASSRSSAMFTLVKALIVTVALASLASPIYVAIRGSGYLNQPPPPFWGVHLAQVNSGSGASKSGAASFGGC